MASVAPEATFVIDLWPLVGLGGVRGGGVVVDFRIWLLCGGLFSYVVITLEEREGWLRLVKNPVTPGKTR